MNADNQKLFLMATLQINYQRPDGAANTRIVNVEATLPANQQLTRAVMDQFRQAAAQMVINQYGVVAEDIREIVFLSAPTALAMLPEHVFYGQEAPANQAAQGAQAPAAPEVPAAVEGEAN